MAWKLFKRWMHCFRRENPSSRRARAGSQGRNVGSSRNQPKSSPRKLGLGFLSRQTYLISGPITPISWCMFSIRQIFMSHGPSRPLLIKTPLHSLINLVGRLFYITICKQIIHLGPLFSNVFPDERSPAARHWCLTRISRSSMYFQLGTT